MADPGVAPWSSRSGMLGVGEGNSGWRGGARLCQEAFAPQDCVCHPSLWPRGSVAGAVTTMARAVTASESPVALHTSLTRHRRGNPAWKRPFQTCFLNTQELSVLSRVCVCKEALPDSRILTPAPPACAAPLLAFPPCCSVGSKAVEAQPALFHQMSDVLALNVTPRCAAESLLAPCGQHTAASPLFVV